MEWEYLDKTFHDEYFSRVHLAPMAVDAIDAVTLAAEFGWSQSLLSMTTHDKLVEIVESRGIAGRFLLIDGLREATGGLKAAHLARHLETLGVEAADAVVIGDTPDDVAAARSVGAAVVVYDGGSHHLHTLEETTAPIAHSLIDALELAR
jgi:phosphoglycolate phosphatase-like HAD superfamily hydrolase